MEKIYGKWEIYHIPKSFGLNSEFSSTISLFLKENGKYSSTDSDNYGYGTYSITIEETEDDKIKGTLGVRNGRWTERYCIYTNDEDRMQSSLAKKFFEIFSNPFTYEKKWIETFTLHDETGDYVLYKKGTV